MLFAHPLPLVLLASTACTTIPAAGPDGVQVVNPATAQEAPKPAAQEAADEKATAPAAKSDLGAEIGETVVTATRVEQPARAVPQSTSVVTADELRTRPFVTLAEALREEPGLWVQKTGSSGGAPILRGQIGNRVLYLWDGVRINNGALFAGPNAFFNQLPWGAVERIEVVRGPGAVQYGSDAIGGVINVITKSLDYFPEKPEFGGTVSTRYGSADHRKMGYADGWYTDRDFNLLVGVMQENVDDYRGGGDAGTLQNTSFSSAGYFGKFGLRLDDHQRLGLSWQQNRRENIESYIQSKLNPSGEPRLFTPAEDRSLLKLDYAARDLDGFARDVRAYVYWQSFDSLGLRTVETSTAFKRTTTDTGQDMYGAGIQAVTPLWNGGRLVYGADLRKDVLATSKLLATTTTATGTTTVQIPQGNVPDGTYDVVDAFVLGEIEPVRGLGLRLFPGVRFETSHLDSNPTSTDTSPGFTERDLAIDKRWNAMTWSLGAIQHVAKGIDIAGDVATGFRAPTFSDTLSFGPGVFSSTTASIPSPDLEPENSLSFEIGPRLSFGGLDASATAWWMTLRDLVQSRPAGTVNIPGTGDLEARQNQNAGRGELHGIDLALRYRVSSEWSLSGQYSQAYGQDTESDVPLRFVPPANALLGCRWSAPGGRLWIEGTTRMVGRKTRHAPDDEVDAGFSGDPGYGSPNSTNNPPLRDGFEIPGYTVYGLRAGVLLYEDAHGSGEAFLAVENLTDKSYREAFSRQLVEPGFNVVIGFTLTF